jgi:hypothetical protein
VWYVTSWSKVLLKFLVTWIKKYPSICWTWKFITMLWC